MSRILLSCFHPGCRPAPQSAVRDSPARTTAACAARRPRRHPKSVADILLAAMYSPRYEQILFPDSSGILRNSARDHCRPASVAPADRDLRRKFCCFCCGSPIAAKSWAPGRSLSTPFRGLRRPVRRPARNGAGLSPEPSGRFAFGKRRRGIEGAGRRDRTGPIVASSGFERRWPHVCRQRRPAG